jgi:tripartite-type tricarboxylate transporter receptor subunit TctC
VLALGKLTFDSAGGGSPSRIAGEVFRSMVGIDIAHVPYRGNIEVVPHQVREGRLRALAVTSPKCVGSAPELPTMAEAGFPGFDTTA